MQSLSVGTIRSLVPHRTFVWDFAFVESDSLGRHPDNAPWPDNKRHFAFHYQGTWKALENFCCLETYRTIEMSLRHDRRRNSSKTFSRRASSKPKTGIRFFKVKKKTFTPRNLTNRLDVLTLLALSLDNYLVAIFLILCQMNSSKSVCSYTFDQRVVIHNTHNV